LSGQELERGAVGGADDVEVATVERRERRDSQSLGGGDDRGVDGPERQVAMASDEFCDPKPVVLLDGDARERPCGEIAGQAKLSVRSEPRPDQICDFGYDEDRTARGPRNPRGP